MSVIIERFLERPTSHKVIFWIGSFAIIGFIFWQYSYGPQSKKAMELEKEIEATNSQIQIEQRTVRNLAKFREEVKALESLRETALAQLPYKREIANLLNSITSLTKDSGLEVFTFAPGKDAIKDFYAEVPVDLRFRGTFSKIMTFFDEVSRLSRIVSVSNINLSNPKGFQEDAQISVDGSCQVITYRHLEEDERIKEDENDQQPRRGRVRAPAPKDNNGK